MSSDAFKRVERESPRGDRGELPRGEIARGGVTRGDVTRRGEVAGDRRRGVERGDVDMSPRVQEAAAESEFKSESGIPDCFAWSRAWRYWYVCAIVSYPCSRRRSNMFIKLLQYKIYCRFHRC